MTHSHNNIRGRTIYQGLRDNAIPRSNRGAGITLRPEGKRTGGSLEPQKRVHREGFPQRRSGLQSNDSSAESNSAQRAPGEHLASLSSVLLPRIPVGQTHLKPESKEAYRLQPGLAKCFCKRPESKCFKLLEPYNLYHNDSDVVAGEKPQPVTT